MVFSTLHWVPSVIAAVLTIVLVFARKPLHKPLGQVMAAFALIGLWGFLTSGGSLPFQINAHSIHEWLGFVTLVLSLSLFAYLSTHKPKKNALHCKLGYFAAAFAALSLIMGLALMSGLTSVPSTTVASIQVAASSTLSEVEATQFNGVQLTPLSEQGNNAIKGTQYIDKSNYTLHVYGLVNKELNMSYGELLVLPAYSEASYMPCVEGWGFMAKWTGFRVSDLLDMAELQPNASYVVFYASDGYSTGLPLDYIRNNKILMAYGINDLTLPPERGFPFQVVAKQKYGYKWAKWVTAIEVISEEKAGYWESRGYSNSADVGGPTIGG
jgi:DMSO/TMAO reductase YedYZ molybdopterin-dependent catalytic subunit